ncbi:MAG: hypothetical protein K6A82_07000 [Prevotella sp.]|nr:hypothetical protein [Prevotella sp.]
MDDRQLTFLEGIGWRYATDHSMLRRMKDHDYRSRCIYMLTLTLADRSCPLLGRLRWSVQGGQRGGRSAELVPSALGQLIASEWAALCRDYPQVQLIRLQLMEEHLHVVIFVRERIPKPLGKLVGIVKNRSNKHYWAQLTAQGKLAPKGVQAPPPLFSANFQDTILSHGGQLETMIRYVEQNPLRAMVRRERPDLFRIVGSVQVSGQTFAAIGNRWLLDRAVRLQVRCHNNSRPENLRLISLQRDYFLDRAMKGAVIVSPCISQGEKEIARAALDAGQPLIVILENGFPPLYKPPGKYFEACAKGLLLMLAPWPYHTQRRTITRQQCLALNAMAAQVSTEPWTEELEKALAGTAPQPSAEREAPQPSCTGQDQ